MPVIVSSGTSKMSLVKPTTSKRTLSIVGDADEDVIVTSPPPVTYTI